MSAAIWSLQSKPHSDPHEALQGKVSIDLEDLVGRSEARRRVRLRIWGRTERDAELAEDSARRSESMQRYAVVKVEPAIGLPCTIARNDADALAQGAFYNQAWAAYPAEDSEPEDGDG